MKKRPYFKLLLIFCSLSIWINSEAQASPIIDSVYFFTERVAWMPDGWGYQFGVNAYDDVPGQSIDSVTAQETTTLVTYNLIDIDDMWHVNQDLAGTLDLNQMLITITNNIGESITYLTLDINPKKLDFVDNVYTSGNILHPTFYWDAVSNADVYRIRISDSSNKVIYNSLDYGSDFSDTLYAIPEGVFEHDQEYTVRISATETLDGVPLNRSSLLYTYSTFSPVPEPASFVLLGAGILAMTYISRRNRGE